MNLFDYQLFAANTNTTTSDGMSAEMKTYYDDYLIDCSLPKLVHDQFAQKRPILRAAASQSSSARSTRCRRR